MQELQASEPRISLARRNCLVRDVLHASSSAYKSELGDVIFLLTVGVTQHRKAQHSHFNVSKNLTSGPCKDTGRYCKLFVPWAAHAQISRHVVLNSWCPCVARSQNMTCLSGTPGLGTRTLEKEFAG